MTAAGNFGLWRCCFFVVFMRFSWGAWEVLPGTVTFLMWEYDRGMVKVGKTGGTGWTGEKEGDRLKIKSAGASYYKSAGGRGRRTAPGKVSGNSARESFRGHFQGKFQRRAPGKVPEGSSREDAFGENGAGIGPGDYIGLDFCCNPGEPVVHSDENRLVMRDRFFRQIAW